MHVRVSLGAVATMGPGQGKHKRPGGDRFQYPRGQTARARSDVVMALVCFEHTADEET